LSQYQITLVLFEEYRRVRYDAIRYLKYNFFQRVSLFFNIVSQVQFTAKLKKLLALKITCYLLIIIDIGNKLITYYYLKLTL